MKIALIGAQGVGKTTLSKKLHMAYPNSLIVKETVRECPYPCDAGADFKTEWWVLSHSILEEQEAREKKVDLVITDRCLLDIAVYTKLIEESGDGRISKLQREMIERVITNWLREDPYDAVFFVRVAPEVWSKRDLDDGFRSLDLNWYQILTKEFEAAIERLEVSKFTQCHFIDNSGNLETAYQKIVSLLPNPPQLRVDQILENGPRDVAV